MANTPAPQAGTTADARRLGPREAARRAALLRLPEQDRAAAGRPIADPLPRAGRQAP